MPSGTTTATLMVIRAALSLTVAGLAVFAITQHQDNPVGVLQYIPTLMAFGVLGALLYFRDLAEKSSGEQARSYTIIAWALGESAALFGWIVHFIGAPLIWAIPGTVVFVMAVSLVAPPPEA